MPGTLEFAPDTPSELRAYFGYETAADALLDPRGVLVRFTPRRRTTMHVLASGARAFCKLRHGRRGDAEREWRNLNQLEVSGVSLPQPLFFARRGAVTMVGIAAVPGRPLDALLVEGDGLPAARRMPSALRALHGQGWVFRDMYWNHVFAAPDGGGLCWVDVERAFAPRWRLRRWVVKDLAGLAASLPAAAGLRRTDRLRFLRDYLGDLDGDWKHLARDVERKAARIAAHTTRYPG